MRIPSLALFSALSLVAAPAAGLAAEPAPALEVVKLKPGTDAQPALTAVDQEVMQILERISDKETGDIEDKEDFERMVSIADAAVPRLTVVLRDQNARFDHRWVSARALGKIGGKDATRALRTALAEDKFSMIRLAAITGLMDLGDTGSFDAFVKALNDDAMVVRSAAADALGVLGDAKAVDPLVKALDREDNFYRGRSLWVRRHIVAALGRIESRASVSRLIKALDDVDPTVNREAIASLEKVTKVSFRVPAANDADRVTRTTPKWKSWWEENKKDYL